MKAMILAAGGATKLYPLTYTLPKPLVPVLNRPVIEHIIELLHNHGIRDLIINLHYLHRSIEEALGDGSRFGVKIFYSFEPELRGTAGGVRQVAEHFQETFVVIGADDLTDMNLTELVEFHRQHQALATLAAVPVQTPTEEGVLELDEERRVTWFLEKPGLQRGAAGNWSNTGVYVFEPEVLSMIPAKGSYDFGRQLFPELVRQRKRFFGYPAERSFWRDIGSHLSYRQAHWELLDGRSQLVVPGEEVRPQIWIEEGAVVSPQAFLKPPVLVGRGARIEADAEVSGPVVLGPGVVVKSHARVRRSVIWSGSTVGSHTNVDDCLVGSDCFLQSSQNYSKLVLASGARLGTEERESSD